MEISISQQHLPGISSLASNGNQQQSDYLKKSKNFKTENDQVVPRYLAIQNSFLSQAEGSG